jgi:6-bladed beta-propeller protein
MSGFDTRSLLLFRAGMLTASVMVAGAAPVALVAQGRGASPTVTPVLEIGGEDVPESYTFNRITGIDVGPDGAIYVLDGGDRMVKVYDAAGRFLRRVGRDGSGPGEFREPVDIRVDSVVRVAEGGLQRVSTFRRTGEHLGTDRLPVSAVPLAVAGYPLRGRLLLVQSAARVVYGGPASENSPVIQLTLVSPDQRAAAFARFDAGATVWHAKGATVPWGIAPSEFGAGGAWAVSGDSLVAVADGQAATVRWYRADPAGRLVPIRTAALPSASRPVTGADLREVERRLRADDREPLPRQVEFIAPPRWSVATRAFFEPDGSLWVRNSASDARGSVWTAFDPAGRVRLHFTLPPHFDLRAARGTRLYGVGTTPNGAQTVRVYRLSTR